MIEHWKRFHAEIGKELGAEFNEVNVTLAKAKAVMSNLRRQDEEIAALKSEVERLTDLNKRAMSIIAAAAVHGGMPITQEVADVRNEIVCGKPQG